MCSGSSGMHFGTFGRDDAYSRIVDGKLIASIYPPTLDYLIHLRERENVRYAVNLTHYPWDQHWIEVSGIECIDIPVIDMTPPSEEQAITALDFIGRSNDGAVMVHCLAGIGRTGTLMALYLVDKGMGPKEAIRHVRGRRWGSIQTESQEEMILKWTVRSGAHDG